MIIVVILVEVTPFTKFALKEKTPGSEAHTKHEFPFLPEESIHVAESSSKFTPQVCDLTRDKHYSGEII